MFISGNGEEDARQIQAEAQAEGRGERGQKAGEQARTTADKHARKAATNRHRSRRDSHAQQRHLPHTKFHRQPAAAAGSADLQQHGLLRRPAQPSELDRAEAELSRGHGRVRANVAALPAADELPDERRL